MAKKRTNQGKAKKDPSGPGNKGRSAGKGGAKKNGPAIESDDSNDCPSRISTFSQIVLGTLFFLAGIATPPIVSALNGHAMTERMLTETNAQVVDETNLSSAEHGAEEENRWEGALPLHTDCDEQNLSQFFHDTPQRGMHLVCLSNAASGELSLLLFRGAYNHTSAIPVGIGSEPSWDTVRKALVTDLRLQESGKMQQPWAIFTPRGERLVGADDSGFNEKYVLECLVQSEMTIIMEGGIWLWPGVRVGFNRTVDLYSVMPGLPGTGEDSSEKKATIETLSLRPLVVSVKGFISKDECKHIQELAGPTLRYSQVSLMDKDKGRPASDWRTSQSTFLPSRKDPILKDLERRTASLTRIPKNHQEHVQVLRYGNGEKYDAHHDFFNPELYKNDPQTIQQIQNGKRNRLATVFWYLSDVAKGGETVFPRHNGLPQPNDFSDCSKGLKVKPEEGKVIIFYSLDAAGKMDELSLHGACKVIEGTKWAANKWVWNAPRNYISDD